MNLSFSYIDNVKPVKMVSSNATYGIGLVTYIVLSFCHLFGIECEMYDKKIEKAKNSAASKLIAKAQKAGATGIMDIKIQMYRTSIFMYGIAYVEN